MPSAPARLLFLILAIVVMSLRLAWAEEPKTLVGVALVIGQSKYEHLVALPNPANDARAMEDLLAGLGFTVEGIQDRKAKRLKGDIEAFIEDAEGADVALVYYSGHGIEAGGENYLLPVDVDIDELKDGGKGLIAVSAMIEDLRAKARVVIVLLDACRTNPFPPNATLRNAAGQESSISAGGLALGRGVSATSSGAAAGDIGTLIGFAAEPGHTALDGSPGGNSPYASAFLRHLTAMDGNEFGTVMRLVAEEVYLKTQGLQRPWVNESLTRFIFLGAAPQPPAGDGGRILGERRQLLLTISALPEPKRHQVEIAAQTAGVPMDALFGLLRALGKEVPSEPAALEKMLNAEAERVKALIASNRALASQDPEIVRLAGLADEALRDGALNAHLAFWQQAKDRFLGISQSLDITEAQLRTRRIEGAEVLANTAAAFELKADYLSAAENYALAFAQVAKWDDNKAWDYKQSEGNAWLSQGDERADDTALAKALAAFDEALKLKPRDADAPRWARTQNNIGNALLVLGGRRSGTATIEQAIAAYELALQVRSREGQSRDWAKTQNNLAIAYLDMNERQGDPAFVDKAIAAYRAALTETPRTDDALTWVTLMSNLGNALARRGGDRLEEAVAVHRAALEERPRARFPMLWAGSQENLGGALAALGKLQNQPKLIAEAISAYDQALAIITRERAPLRWSGLQYNLGNAYGDLAALESPAANLEAAVSHYEQALQEESFERSPEQWGKTQYMLGDRLWALGEQTANNVHRRRGVDAQRLSLQLYTRERNAADWAITLYVLALKLHRLGLLEGKTEDLSEAVDLLRRSLDFYTRDRNATDWADTLEVYADALADLGFQSYRADRIENAISAFSAALEVHTRKDAPESWATTTFKQATAYYRLAVLLYNDGPARQARWAAAAAAEAFEQQGRENEANKARDLLVTLDGLIAKLPP